ncbi:response regulator transcription factor [uncultured Corynebacterium sp.]|uniref:response regulator transcription factor n=1 Tax=uncultured Corynebacterium sp. TaxID=159447 RepID=UPI0025E34178|nr:response regulator transcription factor [uncultured Corynebacterium sp.]
MKILVVDDEQAVCESLRRSLRFNGYDVLTANDGLEAVKTVRSENPELLILDVMMPNMDGLEVCRTLRSEGWDRPILVLTARDGVSDRVAGLDAGADDYLPKPFALEELLARVRSLVRRASAESIAAEDPVESKLSFEDLELDADTREVSRGGRAISLTRTEFALLQLLMKNPRKVLSRSKILEEVWGYDFPTSGNALEVYIGYLRKKTEGESDSRLIHTVRGVGYVLRETNP